MTIWIGVQVREQAVQSCCSSYPKLTSFTINNRCTAYIVVLRPHEMRSRACADIISDPAPRRQVLNKSTLHFIFFLYISILVHNILLAESYPPQLKFCPGSMTLFESNKLSFFA